ncbi:MAG: hypothetical protein ACE5KM_11735 [Planctomycetaceae bacterium]
MRDRIKVLKKGTSSKQARLAAERMVGSVKMTRDHALRVSRILDGTSYFRELPTLRFEVDPRAYFHLSEHPDVTVGLWRAMGISKFRVAKTARDRYLADSGDGTKGTIEVVERDPNHKIILCGGVFKSPFLPKGIRTRSVIHMQTRFTRDKSGKTFATHRAFVHVSFPSTTVDTAAKLFSPLGNAVLDRNFREISLFLHVMSVAMARQPGWVERVAAKMKDATDQQKKDLMTVTAKVYYSARAREAAPLFKTRQEYLRELMRPIKTVHREDGRTSRP